MQDIIANFKKDVELTIRMIVPPVEEDFIKSMDYIFSPLFEGLDDFTGKGLFPSRLIDIGPIYLKITDRYKEEQIKKGYGPELAVFFNRIFFAIIIDIIENKFESQFLATVFAKHYLGLINQNELVLGYSEDDKFINAIKAPLQRKIEIAKIANIEIPTLKDYIEEIKESALANESSLFDIVVIQKIDSALRPHWIDSDSPPLTSIFHLHKWNDNEPVITWNKSRYALLSFIFLINKRDTKINGGTISQLISKSFTIKGKIVSEENLAKSFSKLQATKGSLQPEEVRLIEKIIEPIIAEC